MDEAKTIVLFDFDGTITSRDTLFLFLKYECGSPKYFYAMLLFAPLMVLVKLRLANPDKAKERLLSFLLRNSPKEMLEQSGKNFCNEILPYSLRKGAIEVIEKYKNDGATVAIVTASLDMWVKPFASALGVHVICTKALYDHGKFTGKFDGLNCNRQEKVVRIKQEFNLDNYATIIAYGDSDGDSAMFALANKTFYKPFSR